MERYELTPSNGQKSFYGKAYVEVSDIGEETLYSYGTPIISRREIDGKYEYERIYDDWTQTTGRHITAFCGMNKAEFLSTPKVKEKTAFENIKLQLEKYIKENYKDYVKAVVSIELNTDDEKVLNNTYNRYIKSDNEPLLNDFFYKEAGKDLTKKNSLKEITGNLLEKGEFFVRENKDGKKFDVTNFVLVSNNRSGESEFTKCSVYGEKAKEAFDLRKGDFIKVQGQYKNQVREWKEYNRFVVKDIKVLKRKEKNIENEPVKKEASKDLKTKKRNQIRR